MFRQRHLLEPCVRLDRRQGHRLRKRFHRLDVDGNKNALVVGRIAIAFADDLDDADDLLLLAGVIEERVLALLHGLEISASDEIAHARPRLALRAALDLVVPGKRLGLGFQKPISHSLVLQPCLAGPLVPSLPGIARRKTRVDALSSWQSIAFAKRSSEEDGPPELGFTRVRAF